jgi:hypothetical protein
MSMSTLRLTRAEFERLIDVYGADRLRWPPEARAGAAQLVAQDEQARRLLTEAEALDRALERAPAPSLAAEAALVERILAAAQRSPRMAYAGRPRGAAAAQQAPRRLDRFQQLTRRVRVGWPMRSGLAPAAAVLAVSLFAGVLLGFADTFTPVSVLEEVAGLALDDPAAVALVRGSGDLLDEDQL